MNISIRHLQHFIAVAEQLHFRRAAQLTNVAQPALSRSVQTLETELGVQLLSRNNRNVKLTAAGKEFLAGCTQIVAAMESTISNSIRADQAQFGGLNLGYTYIALNGMLTQLIAAFEQQNPAVSVELFAASTTIQLERLHREELHCCFVSGNINPSAASEIESVIFQTDAFNVIVNAEHPFADKGSISLEELAQEKILLAGQPKESTFNQHVQQFIHMANIDPSIEFVPQDHVGVLGRVALKRGVCIATEGYGCVYTNELRTLKLTGTNAKLPTHMAWRKDLHAESAIKFRDAVLQYIEEKNSAEPADIKTTSAVEAVEPI